jgi:hypothetical protein
MLERFKDFAGILSSIFGYSYNGSRLFDFATGAIVASYPALVDDGLLVI